MKLIAATVVAPLLAAMAFSAAAQDTGVSVDPSLGLSTDASSSVDTDLDVQASTDATTSSAPPATEGPLDAQVTTDNSYSSLTAAINANAAVDLSASTDETKVSVVLVSSLEGDAATEAAALDAAIAAQGDSLATLRSNATANSVISAKLTAEGHSVEDVIAIRTDANGNTLVYVDDRS